MTTWKKNTEEIKVVDLPFCIQAVVKNYIVSVTPAASLQNAFLYTDFEFEGIVSAKLSTEEVYQTIGPYSLTPSCFLGNLSVETIINFRLLFSSVSETEQIIPIYLGYGDNIMPRADSVWHKDTTEDPFFWFYDTEQLAAFLRPIDIDPALPYTTETLFRLEYDMEFEDFAAPLGIVGWNSDGYFVDSGNNEVSLASTFVDGRSSLLGQEIVFYFGLKKTIIAVVEGGGAGSVVLSSPASTQVVWYIYGLSYLPDYAGQRVNTTGTVTALGLYVANSWGDGGWTTIYTDGWASLDSILPYQSTPGNSKLWHSLSIGGGEPDETWSIVYSDAWRDIARLNVGVWQYQDESDVWQNATINTRFGSLGQAFALSKNQMTGTQVSLISSSLLAQFFVSGTLDFAVGMQADGDNVPVLSKYEVAYHA